MLLVRCQSRNSELKLSFLFLSRNIVSNTCFHSILCFRKHDERSKVCKCKSIQNVMHMLNCNDKSLHQFQIVAWDNLWREIYHGPHTFKLHRLILSNVHTKLMLSHNLPESSSKGNNLKLDLVKLFQYSFVRYHCFQSTHSCDNGIIQHYPRCQFDK